MAEGGRKARVNSEEDGRRMRKTIKQRTQEDDSSQGINNHQRSKEGEERIRRKEQEGTEEDGIYRGEMKNGKDECKGRGRFEVGQGSQGNTRGRPSRRGKGRGSRGRGRTGHAGSYNPETQSSNQRKRGRRTTEQMAKAVERAYNNEANMEIRRIIENLENRVLEEASDPEMEDWCSLMPDPGNTRGRLSQYKQALHMYWVMKCLLAKAMEQVAEEMTELAQGFPNLKEEMKSLHLSLLKQDRKLEDIQSMLKMITKVHRKEEVKSEIMVE